MSDVEVFSYLYKVMMHQRVRAYKPVLCNAGHFSFQANNDSDTYWRFLLAPAPGFSSVESRPSPFLCK